MRAEWAKCFIFLSRIVVVIGVRLKRDLWRRRCRAHGGKARARLCARGEIICETARVVYGVCVY